MAPSFFKDYRLFISFRPDQYGKATLFENEHVLVGLNCLKHGQSMEKHAHEAQNRVYLVLEGKGLAWVGDEQLEIKKGIVIWIPSGYTHRIVNIGIERLVMFVGITPSPND